MNLVPLNLGTIRRAEPTAVQKVCNDIGPVAQPLTPILAPEDALDLQAPTLQRPVLLVHGLAQQADTWVNMKNFLCSNAENGYGGVYRPGEDTEFYFRQMRSPDSKVFILNLSDNLASPERTGHEIREAISKIRGATGHWKVDVVTHSMGALQAREALHQGETCMGNLVMIAPPNQGAYGANLLSNATRIGYHHYPEDSQGALQALRLAEGPLGGKANEYLFDLNQSWPTDSRRIDSATIITGIGLPTPDRSWAGVSNGDGMVAAQRAPLGDTPVFVAGDCGLKPGDPDFRDFQMFRYNHLQIVSEAEVYKKVGEVLAQPLPGDRVEPKGDQGELFCDDPVFLAAQAREQQWKDAQISLF